jgi:excinuclease ABC subunit A
MLKSCDWLIELGPGGGAMGGKVIFNGTPMEILHCQESVTGPYLKSEFK